MKKVVLKLLIHDDRDKKKAMKAVSSIEGIDSIAMDMKASTMTVIGEVDPVQVTYKLRKSWGAEIVTVGPAKEEKKKEGDDKEKDKKGDDEMAKLVQLYQKYYGHPQPLYYYPPYSHESHVDDNPTSCTIS